MQLIYEPFSLIFLMAVQSLAVLRNRKERNFCKSYHRTEADLAKEEIFT